MVNAPFLAKERGLDVREIRHDREGDYHTLVAVDGRHVEGRAPRRRHPVRQQGAAAGRACSGSRSRPSSTGTMIYIVNTDTPGFIGKLGTALGEAGINIATFNLGRREARRRSGRAGRGRRRCARGSGGEVVEAGGRARGGAAALLALSAMSAFDHCGHWCFKRSVTARTYGHGMVRVGVSGYSRSSRPNDATGIWRRACSGCGAQGLPHRHV